MGAEHRGNRHFARRIDRSLYRPLTDSRKLTPIETRKDQDVYRVRMLECRHQMHSQLPPTRAWGYEGQYPGPTIEALPRPPD